MLEHAAVAACTLVLFKALLKHDLDLELPWAARYNTWLLVKLTPKGMVFSCSFSFFLNCGKTAVSQEA